MTERVQPARWRWADTSAAGARSALGVLVYGGLWFSPLKRAFDAFSSTRPGGTCPARPA